MAKELKPSGPVSAMVKDFKKKYGSKTVVPGNTIMTCARIPTGVFELDLATGGGLPMGRATTIFGPEASTKTSIAIMTMASCQRMYPELENVFVDVEGCVTGDTSIVDAVSGEVFSAKEVYEKKLPVQPLSYEEESGCLVPRSFTRWYDNGVKPVFEVVTGSTRIKVTGNHKILAVRNGRSRLHWVRADELELGMFVSRPRRQNHVWSESGEFSDVECRWLGYMLGDGEFREREALRHVYENNTDLYWDKVVSVEKCGEEQTYDFTVMGTHNYVANDMVVHNTFDPEWATTLGLDCEKVHVVRPDYAEQAVDMVVQFLRAEDIGVVVLDSIAAMVSTAESESSTEKALVGGSSILVNRLTRLTAHALISAEKEGRSPVLIYINQIRFKIGVLFGSPETTPGGNGPLFQSSMRLRVYGKAVMDSAISTTLPAHRKVTFTMPKNKVRVLSLSGEFKLVTVPHEGLATGECDDWNTVSNLLKEHGQLDKNPNGKGYVMLGEVYGTIGQMKERWRSDKEFAREVREALIKRAVDDAAEGSLPVVEPHDDKVDEDV